MLAVWPGFGSAGEFCWAEDSGAAAVLDFFPAAGLALPAAGVLLAEEVVGEELDGDDAGVFSTVAGRTVARVPTPAGC